MDIQKKLSELFSLEGKNIVLTGAAGGIGSVLARGMAAVGADMMLCDIAMDSLEQLRDEIHMDGGKAGVHHMDMLDMDCIRDGVARIIQDKGRIDVLINCAGINKRDGFLDVTEGLYDRIMGINLKGLYFLSQEVAKHMMREGRGNIINFASHNSVGMLGGCSVYGATKSAVTALTRSMAVEWAQYGIRANAIAPGHILTQLTRRHGVIRSGRNTSPSASLCAVPACRRSCLARRSCWLRIHPATCPA